MTITELINKLTELGDSKGRNMEVVVLKAKAWMRITDVIVDKDIFEDDTESVCVVIESELYNEV